LIDRGTFGLRELFMVLDDVSRRLDTEVEAYLIGGLSMMHHGLKAVTKDVDVVLRGEADGKRFEAALGKCGFQRQRGLSKAYEALGATTVMEGADGMRFDVFVGNVCRKLRLTRGMRQRAERLDLEGRLRLMATAPEDTFLFKSVTDREDDLADMASLAGLGLDWEAMLGELRRDPANYRYLPHFASKLDALEELHGIVAPIRRGLDDEVEVITGMNILEDRFRGEAFTLSDATRCLGEGDVFSRSVLDRMKDLGVAHESDGLYRIMDAEPFNLVPYRAEEDGEPRSDP
jgi:hypothetical protein